MAVVALALGFGANSAIFSLFNQILLRRLPVPAPEELVNLEAPGPKPGSKTCGQAGDCEVVFSEETLLSAIPGVIRRLDPDLPVDRLKTMTMQVNENLFMDRLISTLSAAFGRWRRSSRRWGSTACSPTPWRSGSGSSAYGWRSAPMRGAWRPVLGQVGGMTAVGGVIGLAAALGLARLARSLLFQLQGHDPSVIAAAAAVLTLVALGAGFIPAHRASRLDPMRALRYE